MPKDVYWPQEDTDLIIETINEWLKDNWKTFLEKESLKIIEIGIGSGAVVLFLIKKLNSYFLDSKLISDKIKAIGIDKNPLAIKTSKKNAEKNKLNSYINFYQGDLFTPLKNKELNPYQRGAPYDILIFNPPYLPSSGLDERRNDKRKKFKNLTWNGGEQGYELTYRFLDKSVSFIQPGTLLFLVSSSMVNQDKIKKKFKQLNFKIVTMKKTHIFFEDIICYILKYK